MKATLTVDISWRGVLYETGDREIPDDLAIALGLTLPQPEPTISTPDSPVGGEAIADESAIDKAPKPRRKGA